MSRPRLKPHANDNTPKNVPYTAWVSKFDLRLPGRQTSAQNCGEITNGGVWLRQQMITLLCLLHCCRRGRRSLRDTPPFVKERQRMGHPALFCDLLSRITLTSVGPSFLASSARAEYRLR